MAAQGVQMWKKEALGADEGTILRNAISAGLPSCGAAWRAAARVLGPVALRVGVRGAGDGFRGAECRWCFFKDRIWGVDDCRPGLVAITLSSSWASTARFIV